MKGSFLIKAKDPKIITEQGVRAFVMDKLLNSGFEKGSVTNVDGKIVEVRLEGDKEQILKFKEQLEKDLVSEFGNPLITFTQFKEEPFAEVPSLMRSGQALMIGQLHKGIGVQLVILDTLKTMHQDLKSLPVELGKVLKEK